MKDYPIKLEDGRYMISEYGDMVLLVHSIDGLYKDDSGIWRSKYMTEYDLVGGIKVESRYI